jgi:flagellin-specific chaperone FliS
MVGAQAYATTQVTTASSVQVVVLLYDGAIS